MKKFFKSYLPFTRAGMQTAVTYRVNFLFIVVGCAVQLCVSFFIWSAVFASSNQTDFMGFSRADMITYISIAFLTGFLTYSEAMYVIGEEIREGSIAMRVLKPVSFNLTFLFHELGARAISSAFVFFPVVGGVEIYRAIAFGAVQFDPAQFLGFVVSALLGFMIQFFFSTCCGYAAFVFQNIWGANMMRQAIVIFLSGEVIPLAFLPAWAGNTLRFLPFASLSYTPVMIYLGRYTGASALGFLGLQLFWLLFFVALAEVIWRIVIKRLCVQGG